MPSSSPGPEPVVSDVSVRPARPADAEAVTAVQLAAWRAAYADLLPHGLLDGAHPDDLVAHWRSSVQAPPSARHVVLVAVETARVVGYAVLAPASPPVSDEATGEVVDLVVDPAHQRHGHGSRLLAAAVDLLRAQAAPAVLVWCDDRDEPRQQFLASAGFAEDGTTRSLDLGGGAPVVTQHRLSAAL